MIKKTAAIILALTIVLFLILSKCGVWKNVSGNNFINEIETITETKGMEEILGGEANANDAYHIYLTAFRNAFIGDGGSLIQEIEYLEKFNDMSSVLTTHYIEYVWKKGPGGNTEMMMAFEGKENGRVYATYIECFKDGIVYTEDNGYKYKRSGNRDPDMGFMYPFFFLQSSVKTAAVEDFGNNKKLMFSLNPENMELSDKYLFYSPINIPGGDPDFVTVETVIDTDGEFVELTYSYTFTSLPQDSYTDQVYIEGKVNTFNIKKGAVDIDFPEGLIEGGEYENVDPS